MDIQVLSKGEYCLGKESISGIKQLGQKFVIELLTERDSTKYLPQKGSNFLSRLYKHNLSEYDVQLIFNSVKRSIIKRLNKTLDPINRIANILLDEIQLSDNLVLRFVVSSEAGQTIIVTTPAIKI